MTSPKAVRCMCYNKDLSVSLELSHLEAGGAAAERERGLWVAVLKVQATVMGTRTRPLGFTTSCPGLANLVSVPSTNQLKHGGQGRKKGSRIQGHCTAAKSPGDMQVREQQAPAGGPSIIT